MLYRLFGDINIVIIIELSNSLAFFITLFEYLRNLNKGIIQISLDSLNSDVLKSSLNVGNDYLKSVINGIMLLDDSGLKFQVSTVLTTYNSDIKIMTELFNFLSKLKNITTWNIVTVHDSLNSQLKDFHSLKPSHEQLNKRKHSNKCTFYSLRFGCSFAVANTIKPQLL